MPSPRDCSAVGVEMAKPLLRHRKRTGQSRVAAMLSAPWKSPSLAAPSPKYAAATRGVLVPVSRSSSFKAYAAPVACGIWVPRVEATACYDEGAGVSKSGSELGAASVRGIG